MKKFICLLTVVAIAVGLMMPALSADEASVYVTVANGKLELSAEKVALTDADGDGKLTVNDVLVITHEKYKKGGYETADGQYGRYITKLWGVSTSNVGYCVNNVPASGLFDEVKNGDYVAAYIYTDTQNFSDAYCYFDKITVSAVEGEKVALMLSRLGYDDNYNTVVSPVAGAVIYIDGKATELKTDESGKVELASLKAGNHVISASVEGSAIVPPVALVGVTDVPKTGDMTFIPFVITFIALMFAGTAVAVGRRRSRED